MTDNIGKINNIYVMTQGRICRKIGEGKMYAINCVSLNLFLFKKFLSLGLEHSTNKSIGEFKANSIGSIKVFFFFEKLCFIFNSSPPPKALENLRPTPLGRPRFFFEELCFIFNSSPP